MQKQDRKNLKKRYLLWLYKTTKEALDRIERKFTQLEIDEFILRELRNSDKDKKMRKHIREYEGYIRNKEKEGLDLKYKDSKLRLDYSFLVLKLKAIESAIVKELGKDALRQIQALYEKEMTERILKSIEHK
jgi:hypothetical protein